MTTTSTPQILIIIVSWNKKPYVLDLLASLAMQDYPTTALDVLVIDNASTDGTVEAITTQFPQVKLLCNQENLGGTGGFNTGLQWAFAQPTDRYQYLWLLDNDVLVHRQALSELVALLEAKPDVAVAGATMMQLDYPWRINEMGAFLDQQRGTLILYRHLEPILSWQGVPLQDLLTRDPDLSKRLMHCRPFMDVDYVAAASLLIRTKVAKEAGAWRDYFIHYDDVEWCLRIAKMGHRILVSAKSLIWHLSAAAKVPTWVLYYDNRNILDLLKTHGADAATLKRITQLILKKAVYYHLIGKPDIAQLHHWAIEDFQAGRFGKRDIKLACQSQKNVQISQVLLDPTIKRILMAFTVNVHATGIQEALVQAQLQRPELQIDWMCQPDGLKVPQVPRSHFLAPFLASRIRRWLTYFRMRNCYDLIIQSDYQPLIGLCWLNTKLLFINDEGFCVRPPPQWREVWRAGMRWLRGCGRFDNF